VLERLKHGLPDAQNHVIQASAPDGKTYSVFRAAEEPALTQHVRTEPVYLLLSKEEAGFAGQGFRLEDPSGGGRMVWAGHADLVVDEEARLLQKPG